MVQLVELALMAGHLVHLAIVQMAQEGTVGEGGARGAVQLVQGCAFGVMAQVQVGAAGDMVRAGGAGGAGGAAGAAGWRRSHNFA